MLQLTPCYTLPGLPLHVGYVFLSNGFLESAADARVPTLSSWCGLVSLSSSTHAHTGSAVLLKNSWALTCVHIEKRGTAKQRGHATDLDKDYRCYSGFTAMQNKKMQED